MKNLLYAIVDLGVKESRCPAEKRKIRIINLLNLVVITSTLISSVHKFFLGDNFLLIPAGCVVLLATVSLYLTWIGKTEASFTFLTIYINLTVFFYTKLHGFYGGDYLYFFPLIVSIVLLTNNAFPRGKSMLNVLICLVSLLATIIVPWPSIQQDLTEDEIHYLIRFNLAISVLSTVLLSVLLARIIAQQSEEINDQNTDLMKTREEVKLSLKEKEVLLAELHHRVKNNLAIISGLLNLQDDATENEEAKLIIGESKSRIMSMALVHRMLYEHTELKSLDLGRYSSELVKELFNSYNLSKQVDLREDCDKIILPVNKSIPLGLILNEIVTNSIKYVFRFKRAQKGELFISLKNRGTTVELIVKDNGDGFPANFNPEAEHLSLGIYLIKTLVEQIDGKVKFSNDNGAKIQLDFALQ